MKAAALEVPPPGVVLNTVTCAVPGEAISADGTAAVTWLGVTKVVVRFVPFHFTRELGTKLEPATVSLNAAVPCITLFGVIEVIAGTGLFTTNVAEAVPPPGVGLVTDTLAF